MSNFFGWISVQRLITDSYNMARFSPALAIMGFKEAAAKVRATMDIEHYNRMARQANATLDNIERQRYYDKKVFWGDNVKPERVSLIDYDFTIDDHLAKQ